MCVCMATEAPPHKRVRRGPDSTAAAASSDAHADFAHGQIERRCTKQRSRRGGSCGGRHTSVHKLQPEVASDASGTWTSLQSSSGACAEFAQRTSGAQHTHHSTPPPSLFESANVCSGAQLVYNEPANPFTMPLQNSYAAIETMFGAEPARHSGAQLASGSHSTAGASYQDITVDSCNLTSTDMGQAHNGHYQQHGCAQLMTSSQSTSQQLQQFASYDYSSLGRFALLLESLRSLRSAHP